MQFRFLAIVCLAACVTWAAGGSAAQRSMPIEEIRPGMVGTGRTVFQGDAIEEFTVRVIGVLGNNVGPRRDLILARLEGGPLAKTGVIAGMSGSPVYIDGRLIGAVAYSLGSFPTEPIAGITPIGEMIEATAVSRPAASRVGPIPADASPADFLAALRAALQPPLGFAPSGSSLLAGDSSPIDSRLAAGLNPIATPLSFGSWTDAAVTDMLGTLGPAGFVAAPTRGRNGQNASPPRAALRPGDPLGVALISGDFSVAATGTITDVDGSRVYAFGHAFFNLGTTRLPMTRAYVHTVLPSLMSSIKVASAGEIVGTIVQDRVTGIAGMLGDAPDTVPLSLTIHTGRGGSRTLDLGIARDPLLTPLFTYSALLGAFGSYEREAGAAAYAVRGRIAIRDRGTIEYSDILTGDSASIAAAATVAVPVGALMSNDIEAVQIDRVDLDVTTAEQPNVASIQRAWLDSADVRPGRQVPLKVHLRTWRGDDDVRTIPIEIPAGAPGPLTLLVADAARMSQWERENAPPAPPASIDQLVRQIRRLRRNNVLYVRLYTRGAGAVINGEPLPALPASVLTVMQGDRSSSASAAMQSVVVGSWDVPLPHAITGSRTLQVATGTRGPRP